MPKLTLSFLCVFFLLLSACARTTRPVNYSLDSLASLQAMAYQGNPQQRTRAETTKIREMAIKETALSLGAQAGLAARAKIIDEQLNVQARTLDTVYDFNSLVLEHNILPPVLIEGRNILNLADAQSIRLSDRVYKIAKQARFVTTPPTWRQYLWLDYERPEAPNVTLLPKTQRERALWRQYTQQGWENGIEQANYILEDNLARIKEDFKGMILYRKLLAMNMVSAPYVSHTDLGITGDETELHIDDRILRITALPILNVNSDEWKAAVAKNENVLEHYKEMENGIQQSRIVISSNAWQPTIAPVN